MKFTTAKGFISSPMELILEKRLQEINVGYNREVIYDDCVNPITGMQLRYDFYIPRLKMLVEYDGKASHESDEVKFRDRIKDKFAKENNIKLVRLSGMQSIETFISTYLSAANVNKENKSTLLQKNKIKKKKNKCQSGKSNIKDILAHRSKIAENEQQRNSIEYKKSIEPRDMLRLSNPIRLLTLDFLNLRKLRGYILKDARQKFILERRQLANAGYKGLPRI